MIEMQNLKFSRGQRLIIDDVTVTAHSGRVLGLVGPNGAGKSTLLNLIYRLLEPEHGDVLIDSRKVKEMKRSEVAKEMAVVAQHGDATMPLSVYDSIALGLLSQRSMMNYGRDHDRETIMNAIKHVGLAGYEQRLSSELSGGEWQRVLIARAIVQNASHLLLDEPTNHLDIHHQYSILQLMREMAATTVIVLHDLNLASQFCDDLVLLQNGKIVAAGTPNEVLTAERVSEVYRIRAEVVDHGDHRHLVYRSLDRYQA